jgi:hypothetical protein
MREPTEVTACSWLVSFGRGCKRGSGGNIGVSRRAQANIKNGSMDFGWNGSGRKSKGKAFWTKEVVNPKP